MNFLPIICLNNRGRLSIFAYYFQNNLFQMIRTVTRYFLKQEAFLQKIKSLHKKWFYVKIFYLSNKYSNIWAGVFQFLTQSFGAPNCSGFCFSNVSWSGCSLGPFSILTEKFFSVVFVIVQSNLCHVLTNECTPNNSYHVQHFTIKYSLNK